MEYIDLFKVNFQFHIFNKSLFSTRLSQVSSILFLLVSLFTFIWNLNTMFQRSTLNINSYRTNINEDDKIVFNETNSFLGFSLKKDLFNGEIPKNSTLLKYLTIRPYAVNFSINESISTNLSLMNCNQTFNKFFYNSFQVFPDYCVNFNNSLSMNNFYSTDDLKFFYFSIEFDKVGYLRETNTNSTDDILCYLYFFFPISLINLNNMESPYNITMGYYSYPLYSKLPQSNLISYEITEIHTDSNFIGKNDKIDKVLSTNYNFIPFSGGQVFEGSIFEFHLFIYPIKYLYFRSYMKFQDVLNNTNSSVSFMFLVFKILCSSINNSKLKINLIKENILYQIKFNRDDLFKIDKNLVENQFHVIEESKREDSKSVENKSKEINDLKSIKIKEDSIRDYKELEIDDHSSFYMNLLSCICKKPKFENNNFIIKSVYSYYESMIDVSKILINLHKLENLIKTTNYSSNLNENKILLKIGLKNK